MVLYRLRDLGMLVEEIALKVVDKHVMYLCTSRGGCLLTRGERYHSPQGGSIGLAPLSFHN